MKREKMFGDKKQNSGLLMTTFLLHCSILVDVYDDDDYETHEISFSPLVLRWGSLSNKNPNAQIILCQENAHNLMDLMTSITMTTHIFTFLLDFFWNFFAKK